MKPKLKIGFFTDTYYPQVNGVVTSIESFRKELEKQGHEVFVFCPRANSRETQKNVIRFPSIKFFFQPEYHVSVPFTRHLLKNLWQKDLDIVHAHTPFSLGLLGYYYAYIKKVPFVYTYHTLYPEYVKSYLWHGRVITPRLAEKVTAVFSNHCDLNIAPSEKIRLLLKKYGVTKPISVLPTGLDLKKFSQQVEKNKVRSKYGIKPDEKALLYVGRLGKEKNIGLIVKTLRLLKDKGLKVKLLIVGDGPDRLSLQNLVKNSQLSKEVIFAGYLRGQAVVSSYQAADLFVFASQTDTQGLVMLEAAACGLPIVAVKDAAFANILKNGSNGFTVSQDPKEFSQKITTILSNKKLYQKMSAASVQTASGFSSKNQGQKLEKLYFDLLEK